MVKFDQSAMYHVTAGPSSNDCVLTQSFTPMVSTQASLVQFPTPMTYTVPSSTHWMPSNTQTVQHSAAWPSVDMSSCVSNLPWSVQTDFSNSSADVMRFRATTTPSDVLSPPEKCAMNVSLHGKRKAGQVDLSSECPKPRKIFVNEERMAARMHGLHLDNNNLDWHPDLEQEPWYALNNSKTNVSNQGSLPDVTSLPLMSSIKETARLELCTELQLGLKTKEILPQVILDELNKPSMQIVLWRPPGSFVRDVINERINSSVNETTKCDDDNEKIVTDCEMSDTECAPNRQTSVLVDMTRNGFQQPPDIVTTSVFDDTMDDL